MNILVVSQRFWPESFRINEICFDFIKRGHNVTVLTGLPMYPGGYIFKGYKKKLNKRECINGVNVIRVSEAERKQNLLSRIVNYYSFQFLASRKIRKMSDHFDVVFVNGLSPIMSAIPAIIYKKKHPSVPIIMYEMDLWPESLLSWGISKKSIIYKLFMKKSAKIYSKFDRIFVSTKEHKKYIQSMKNCNDVKIDFLPQFAEDLFLKVKQRRPQKNLNLLFAGNIGKAQSVETIIRAADLLKKEKRFTFNFVGDGSSLQCCKNLAKNLNLNNVKFYGSKPLDDMLYFYEKADIMLVSLEDKNYANMTLPGKIQSYMASGKPIFGALSGSGNTFINNMKIGVACKAGDYVSLANIVRNTSTNKLIEYGKRAREIYLKSFKKEIFIDTLLESFSGQ